MPDNIPNNMLDRRIAVPQLIGDPADFLLITGLAGPAKDVAAHTKESDNAYMLGGAMGAAVSMGLGLALAQPERRVLVVTGDGELLMNLSALATVGAMQPKNLAIACVDNARYGETGNQLSHTGLGVDLAGIAHSSGIASVCRVEQSDQIAGASQRLREDGACFVLLRVSDGPCAAYRRNWDAVDRKNIFRRALLADSPANSN